MVVQRYTAGVPEKKEVQTVCHLIMAASMIHPGKKQVELWSQSSVRDKHNQWTTVLHINLKLGNYGNKLETTIVKQPSTTKPEGPVYDGNSQYSLDWGRNKPCLMVDSNWEDCQYRIETLNYLLSIVDYLVSSCSKFGATVNVNFEHFTVWWTEGYQEKIETAKSCC